MSEYVSRHCNACLRQTKHLVAQTFENKLADGRIETFCDEHDEPLDFQEEVHRFEIVECCGCGEVHFNKREIWVCPPHYVRTAHPDYDGEDDQTHEIITEYPARVDRSIPAWIRSLPRDNGIRLKGQREPNFVPAPVFELFEEVYGALHISSTRLAAMGLRAIIDLVCADKVGDCGGFKQKLDALVAGEFLSSRDRDTLSAAIDLGSAAAHRGHAPALADAYTVLDIVEHLVDKMYRQPAQTERLRASTPARGKKSDT